MTGDSFEIKDYTGRIVFKVDGKFFTLHQKKALQDAHGNELVSIQAKILSLHKTQHICSPDGAQLAEVKKKKLIEFVHHNAEITTTDGQEFSISGDFLAKNFHITDVSGGSGEIATVNRDIVNFRNFLTDQDTYALHVKPGVDLAFMVAICICVDELFNDKQRHG
jgi:uncharacterized protein YxjI